MNELYDSIKCLCESPQRLQILDALDSTQMDLRSLMTVLESPRTTLQRNLSILEQREWVKEIQSGYTTTTAGHLILEEAVALDETITTINRIAPFLAAVDTPITLDIRQLSDARMTVPEPTQPNAPMQRLRETFDGADRIRGCLPVVSWVLVELSRQVEEDVTTEHEYIISQATLDALDTQYAADRNLSETALHYLDIYVSEKVLPYGLFFSEDRLALTAYNEIDRIQALVESDSDEVIEWGERMYETYRQQSKQLRDSDIPVLIPDVGSPD